MIVQDVVSDVLLGLAVIMLLVSSLGVAVMDDVYQRIHFVTPAALVAPVLVALAVTVQEGYSENTTETWLAVFFVVIAGPVLSHATVRAARIRDKADWRPLPGRAAGGGEQEE